jgi:4'-phosphopantetheinyl transferase
LDSNGKSEFALRDGEIHVWSASLEGPTAFTQWQYLSEDEKLRAGRFLFAEGRARYVCGRSVVRLLVGRYLEVAPEAVRFRRGPHSKPELAPPFHQRKLQFNLSHSNSQLLVAFARSFAVGVDLEMVRPETDIDKIAKRFFSFNETEQLGALSGSARRAGFFNGWTRKEAYLKARGDGIGYGLDRFAVALTPGEPVRLLDDRRDPEAVRCWSIAELAAAPGYVAAVSAKTADFRTRQFAWNASSASLARNPASE